MLAQLKRRGVLLGEKKTTKLNRLKPYRTKVVNEAPDRGTPSEVNDHQGKKQNDPSSQNSLQRHRRALGELSKNHKGHGYLSVRSKKKKDKKKETRLGVAFSFAGGPLKIVGTSKQDRPGWKRRGESKGPKRRRSSPAGGPHTGHKRFNTSNGSTFSRVGFAG